MKRKFTWHWLICFLFIGIVCFMPTDTAKAAVEYKYEFDEKTKTYYITYISGTDEDGTLELPTSYNGYPVTGVRQGTDYDSLNVTKIIVPKGYTYLESYAFAWTSKVTQITLPNTLETIGESAFYGSGIKTITIPASVTSMEGHVFRDCKKLQTVKIKAKISTIKEYTFAECPKLKTVTLPKTITTIERFAFRESGIKYITLPQSVRTVEDRAFQNCENLYQVIAKGEFTDIDEYAFYESPSNQITIVADRKSDTYVNAASNGFVVTDTTKQKIDVHGKKMFVGEKKYISVYNNPYKVKWSSSKKSVVSVNSEGLLTAKKTGTATITAKINGKKYTYKITVVKRTEKNVLNIAWSNYVTKDMSDYEKVFAASKFLAQTVEYDMRLYTQGYVPSISHTTKGALEKGVAVCDGYAYAFQKIIEHYDIPVKDIHGKADNGSGYMGHAWNLVKIGTKWYHVDPTWNDPVNYYGNTWDNFSTDFLLISDKEIGVNHTWKKSAYPKATATDPDRYITTGGKSQIKISSLKDDFYVGKTATLTVSGTTKKATWSSSNKKIVTVNSKGKITAKKAGTAKIYCKVNGKKYTIKVTVKNPYLNATELSMVKGGNGFQLSLTGATAKTYTSSNSSVVKVSKKGALTAKKAGKATISVKASNGKTYKCKVTVNAYALNKTKLSLNAGDTYALSLKGIDKNTYVCWTSSNTQVATVDFNGKVTAKGKGTTTISAEVDGAVYKCKVTVHEHTMEWKAESDAHGAKAQWICTGCREIMKEGVQLIAENGEKRYGYWNTTVTDADMLKRLNQKLQSEGFQAMVEDATLESDLIDLMLLHMNDNIYIMKNIEDTFECYNSYDETEDVYDDIETVYQWLRPRNEYKNVSYTHRFAMISFVWDAYEDGSDYITIYVFASVNDTNES